MEQNEEESGDKLTIAYVSCVLEAPTDHFYVLSHRPRIHIHPLNIKRGRRAFRASLTDLAVGQCFML